MLLCGEGNPKILKFTRSCADRTAGRFAGSTGRHSVSFGLVLQQSISINFDYLANIESIRQSISIDFNQLLSRNR